MLHKVVSVFGLDGLVRCETFAMVKKHDFAYSVKVHMAELMQLACHTEDVATLQTRLTFVLDVNGELASRHGARLEDEAAAAAKEVRWYNTFRGVRRRRTIVEIRICN